MTDKEILIKKSQELRCLFSKHLNAFNQIPPQNFSEEENLIKDKLEGGILGVDSVVEKLNKFDGNSKVDLSLETSAINSAKNIADVLEGKIDKNLQSQEIIPQNKDIADAIVQDLISKSNIPTDIIKEEQEDIAPSIQAFFSYVNEITLKNFGFVALGDKFYNTNLTAQAHNIDKKLDQTKIDKGTSTLIGAGLLTTSLLLAYQALKNKKNYNEYATEAQNKNVRPLSETEYEKLSKEDGLENKTYEGFSYTDINGNPIFILKNDICDLVNYSLIKADESIEKSIQNNINFSKSELSSDEIYFSVLKSQFDKNFSTFLEYNYYAIPFLRNFDTLKDPVKKGLIGGAIGAIGLGGIEAMKKSKDYDAYAAMERAHGRIPVSKAKWVLSSEEVLSKAALGGVGGAAAGAGLSMLKNNNKEPLEYYNISDNSQTDSHHSDNTSNKKIKNSNAYKPFNPKGADTNNLNILKGLEKQREAALAMGSKEKRDFFGDGRSLTRRDALQEIDAAMNKHNRIYEDKGLSWDLVVNKFLDGKYSNSQLTDLLSSYDKEGASIIKRLKEINLERQSVAKNKANDKFREASLDGGPMASYKWEVDETTGTPVKRYYKDTELGKAKNNFEKWRSNSKKEALDLFGKLYDRNRLGMIGFSENLKDDLMNIYYNITKEQDSIKKTKNFSSTKKGLIKGSIIGGALGAGLGGLTGLGTGYMYDNYLTPLDRAAVAVSDPYTHNVLNDNLGLTVTGSILGGLTGAAGGGLLGTGIGAAKDLVTTSSKKLKDLKSKNFSLIQTAINNYKNGLK